MSIRLGLTGGIGSGKSFVAQLLESMGIPVYNSDARAKYLSDNDPEIQTKLIHLFGNEIYLDYHLNRPLLASYIFNDAECAAHVNNIIHPRVKEDFQEWVAAHADKEFVAMESAILIESGFQDQVDYLIMVSAPVDVRINRVIARDTTTRDQVLKRINSQMNDEQKKEYAHFIINNDGNTPLESQILSLLEQLRQQ